MSECEYFTNHCAACGGGIEFPATGVGVQTECPHCRRLLTLELPVPVAPPPRSSTFVEQLDCEFDVTDATDARREWVKIRKLDFHGQCSRSLNGHFILAWNNSGLYFLLEDNRVVTKGKLQSPNDGKVSNVGNFILNGWTNNGGEPSGTFYAFTATGTILVRKRFRASPNGNGISDDGRFAFCDTCTSDYEAHSDKTFLFDLEAKALLSTLDGRADDGWYQFDSQHRILSFIRDDAMVRRYTFEGECLGVDRLSGEMLASFSSQLRQDWRRWRCHGSENGRYWHFIAMCNMCGMDPALETHHNDLIGSLERELEQEKRGLERQELSPDSMGLRITIQITYPQEITEETRSQWRKSRLAEIHRSLTDLYKLSGDEPRAAKHRESWFLTASGNQLFCFAEYRIQKFSGTPLGISNGEAIAIMERALGLGVYHQASGHRTLGEICLRCGDKQKALVHLETALRLNPRIGVQKLVKRLTSEVQTRE